MKEYDNLQPEHPYQKMASLQEVQMPQNGINHAGVTALAQAFAHNHALRILNLSDNTFTEKGSLSMARVGGWVMGGEWGGE